MGSNAPFAFLFVAMSPALVGLVVFCIQMAWPRILPRLVVIPPIRRRWARCTRVFARANIATLLVPLVDEVFKNFQATNGKILIVGSDGMYLVGRKNKMLQRAIRAWTARGMNVRYLLVDPSDEALAELEQLRQELEVSDKLDILPLKALPKDAPHEVHVLAEFLLATHLTLIEFAGAKGDKDQSKRIMWIEGKHWPKEMHSFGNRWVAPDAMSARVDRVGPTWDALFSQWADRLEPVCEYAQHR